MKHRRKKINVFLVIQKDKPDSRVRGVFSTKKAARDFIQTKNPMIPCDSCGQSRANPDYNPSNAWKLTSIIEMWDVSGEQRW